MTEATATMLRFPPISSSGPWWLTERRCRASPGNQSLLKDSLRPSSESSERTTLRTRCSTVSTSSVRSSRAPRRKTAVRSQGQGTSAPQVSSWTLMHRGRPAPAHYRRVRAPTHAHPTNRINKAGRGHSVTRWAGTEQRVLPRPWEEQTWLQNPPQPGFFPLGTEGACVLPTPQAVSGGGGGLDPSIPTSKLTQVPARTENRPKLEGISKKKRRYPRP